MLLLARNLDLEQFGRMALAFMAVGLVTMALRSTTAQALLLRPRENAIQGYLAVQILGAGVAAVTTAALSVAFLDDLLLTAVLTGAAFVAVCQDGYRYAFIVKNRWARVALADTAWLAAVVPVVFVSLPRAPGHAVLLTAAWGGGAVLAAVLLEPTSRHHRPRRPLAWTSANRDYLLPLAGEVSVFIVAGNVVNWVVVAVTGYAGLGRFRAAQVAVSPLATVVQAIGITMLSRSGGTAEQNPPLGMFRQAYFLLLLWASAMAWWLLLLLPGVGEVLLGGNWAVVADLLAVVILGQLASMATSIVMTALKLNCGPGDVLRLRLCCCWLDPALASLGGVLLGSTGAVVGLTVSQVCTALVATFWCYGGRKSNDRTSAPRRSALENR